MCLVLQHFSWCSSATKTLLVIFHTIILIKRDLFLNSTLDVLIQIKELVINQIDIQEMKAILALDLNGTYDDVAHYVILANLVATKTQQTNMQLRPVFLGDHTATRGIGNLQSDSIPLAGKGTPQGYTALSKLPPLLDAIS